MSDDAGGRTEETRGGVFSVSFLALVATQFFVSLNDNMFRWLVVPVGKELMGKVWHDMPAVVQHWMTPKPLALSLGLASFTLPFLVFAAPGGFLADRFSKRNVMVACKAAEIVVIGLGIASILLGSVWGMFLMLFILGTQATMFITSKLSAIPEIVRSDKIAAANGVINMVSMAAIIIGMVAGNWLYDQTKPAGQGHWWIYAAALLGVAVCGLVTSLFIGPLRAANPSRPIPWNPARQTVRDLSSLFSKQPLFLAALGSTYFWLIGAISNVNIDQFATVHLGVEQRFVGPLLAMLAVGIAVGAMLAGTVSRGKVELGLVPLGGLGIALTCILVAFVPAGTNAPSPGVTYYTSCVLLAALGTTAGLYDIPLQAFLQDRSPAESRGSIMAAYNFMAFAGMLGGSGVYWLLSGPLKLTSPGSSSSVAFSPCRSHSISFAGCRFRRPTWRFGRSWPACIGYGWKGRKTSRPRAARCWWPTTSVGPTACCWVWPARGFPAWLPTPSISKVPGWAGLVASAASSPSAPPASRWPSRSGPPARLYSRARWCVSFPKAASPAAAKSRNFAPASCRS